MDIDNSTIPAVITLTPAQEKEMEKERDRWVEDALKGREINKEKAIAAMTKLYNMTGLETPEFYFAKSPLEAQLKLHELKYGDKASKTKIEFEYFGADAHVGIAGWLGWISYLDSIGIKDVKRIAQPLFDVYESGLYDTIQLTGVCIIVERPTQVAKDERNRLHRLDGPAFDAENNEGCGYFIHGISFSKDLYNKITQRKMKAEEILKMSNIEQRRIALELYGYDNLIRDLKSQVVETSPRGNELYKIQVPDLGNAYILRYTCPSTGRVYVSPVNATEVERWKDRQADRAMARKFDLTLAQYDALKIEA